MEAQRSSFYANVSQNRGRTRDRIGTASINSLYIKCRSLAVMYLEIGETNEALFWLNAGIESLFQNRFKEIALATGRTNLEDELNSPNVYWNDAEEIVKKQFPELAGKIEWPDSKRHVSVYQKLKCLHTSVPMKTSLKELNAKYDKISKHRNLLVHGVIDQRLPEIGRASCRER